MLETVNATRSLSNSDDIPYSFYTESHSFELEPVLQTTTGNQTTGCGGAVPNNDILNAMGFEWVDGVLWVNGMPVPPPPGYLAPVVITTPPQPPILVTPPPLPPGATGWYIVGEALLDEATLLPPARPKRTRKRRDKTPVLDLEPKRKIRVED